MKAEVKLLSKKKVVHYHHKVERLVVFFFFFLCSIELNVIIICKEVIELSSQDCKDILHHRHLGQRNGEM